MRAQLPPISATSTAVTRPHGSVDDGATSQARDAGKVGEVDTGDAFRGSGFVQPNRRVEGLTGRRNERWTLEDGGDENEKSDEDILRHPESVTSTSRKEDCTGYCG